MKLYFAKFSAVTFAVLHYTFAAEVSILSMYSVCSICFTEKP